MRRFALLLLLGAAAAAGLRAAPLERDLGAGLLYFRVHKLPDDLPSAEEAAGRCVVLDIRFVQGDAIDGADLFAWLRHQASLRHPVLLLANQETGPALLTPLDSPDAVVGLIILGPSASGFTPDIAIDVSPKVDRRAYEALEHGATVDSLTVYNPVKTREDEAMLVREHLPDYALGDTDDDSDQSATSQPAPTPPLQDAVLKRAIQLDRALLALKRID